MATAADAKQDPALERVKRIIRGMLDRTEDRGCSEAEALEAAEKVGALLEQYNLTLDAVTLRETKMVQREVYAADRAAQSVVTGIGRLCSLKTYHKGGQTVTTYVMYGHAHDLELAVYLYEVVCEAMDDDFVKDMERNGFSKARRESFRAGFAERIYSRLTQMRAERDAEMARHVKMSGGTDIVVLKDQLVEAEFAKEGVKLVTTTRVIRDRAAYYRGNDAGKRVNLNSPLENARKGQGRLA